MNVTTVDAFLESRELAHRHIQHMTIDTEGWDPLVLEGSTQTLAARRVPTISFEFIARGYWRNPAQRPCPRFLTRHTPQCDNGEILPKSERRDLGETLRRLEAFGYSCFWQTSGGGLVPASGVCWQPRFARVGWANLLCAHQRDVLRLLRRLQPSPASLVKQWGKDSGVQSKQRTGTNKTWLVSAIAGLE